MYTGSLFNSHSVRATSENYGIPKELLAELVKNQADAMIVKYGTTVFTVKQLQEILQIGENTAYDLMSRLPVVQIGRQKVIAALALAYFLLTDFENSA